MRLLDLSRNKLTILPNLLVWRSEVPSTAARPGGVERQGAQAFKEEQFLEKNEDEMYEEIIDDLYEKVYMISKQIKSKVEVCANATMHHMEPYKLNDNHNKNNKNSENQVKWRDAGMEPSRALV